MTEHRAPLVMYHTDTLRRMAEDLAHAADEHARIEEEIRRRENRDAITASSGDRPVASGRLTSLARGGAGA